MTMSDIREALSQSRAFLMGVAMLMVMCCHHGYFVDFGITGNGICLYGEWGVDVFIFLSGFGVSFSLGKKALNAETIRQFYQRRFYRIMPTAVCIGWLLAPLVLSKDTAFPWLNLVGLGWWYIRTILILYLLAPFLFMLFKNRYPFLNLFLIFVLCLIYGIVVIRSSLPFLSPFEHFHLFRTAVVTVLKIPVFALGMLAYSLGNQQRKFSLSMVMLLLVVSMFACVAIENRTLWPYSLFTTAHYFAGAFFAIPCFCLMGRLAWKYLPACVVSAVERIGKISLEIYLVHECVFIRLGRAISLPTGYKLVIVFIASVAAAYLLKQLVKLLENAARNWWA